MTEDSESLDDIKNRKELYEEMGVSKSTISEDFQTLSKLWRDLETES
jgi:predicted DNA-binding transcriptional regulator YafY